MKKGSTVAIRQRSNISQQKLTIGLDLGDRNSWTSAITAFVRRNFTDVRGTTVLRGKPAVVL